MLIRFCIVNMIIEKIISTFFYFHLIAGDQSKENVTWQLNALDCGKANNVKTSLLAEVCNIPPVYQVEDNITATILVERPSNVLKVYACTKYMSAIKTSCTPINGSDILLPPDILKQVDFSGYKCQGAVDKKEYTTEDGRKLTIQPNNTYQYKYVQQSTLKVSPAEASCTGDSVTLGITRRTGIISLIEVSIHIQEIMVDSNYQRLDNNVELPKRCHKHSTCVEGKTAFYIPNRTDGSCPYKQLKRILLQQVKVTIPEGDVTVFLSESERFAIVKREKKVNDNIKCTSLSDMITTQYADIKLILSEKNTDTALSSLETVDLSLEQKLDMTGHYLEFMADFNAKQDIHKISKSLCELSKPNLAKIGKNPSQTNTLIKIRGEVIQEIQCTTEIVEARKGDKHEDLCTTDLLPVWLNLEPVYLQANTRLIVPNMKPNQIDCSMRYSPIFVTNDGALIKAKPEIQQVKIAINPINSQFFDRNLVDIEIDEAYSKLQYKPEELTAYQDYLYHQQARENVLQALVHQYCQSGDCGDYKPIRGSGNFKMSNLYKIKEEGWIFTRIARILNWIGSYCSIIVLLYIILSFLIKILNIGRLICFEHLTTGSAIRLNFLVSQQLSNILLHDNQREDNREVIQLVPQHTSNTRQQQHSNVRQNYTVVDRRWYN